MAGFDWPPVPAVRVEDQQAWRLRALMLEPRIVKVLSGAEPMPGFNHSKANALMTRFVRNLPMHVGMSRARDGAAIKRLEGGDEVWSLCIRHQGPGGKGWRILGRFAERDFFVGLLHAPRICLNDPMEQMLFATVAEMWAAKFPGLEPLRSNDVSDYMERYYD